MNPKCMLGVGKLFKMNKKSLGSASQVSSKPSEKGKGKTSLGHGVGKASKEDPKSLASASQVLSKPSVDPDIVRMWKAFYFHDHSKCIQQPPLRLFDPRKYRETLLEIGRIDGKRAINLDVKLPPDYSSSSDSELDKSLSDCSSASETETEDGY